jgi:hypothetical protein
VKATVVKYYSVTSGPFESCLKRLHEVQEKHPDRDYVLLKNMRGYYTTKCSLVQRVEVEIDFPTEKELNLPAPVPKPAGLPSFGTQRDTDPRWQAYDRDQQRRKKYIGEAQEPAFKLLKESLNPNP